MKLELEPNMYVRTKTGIEQIYKIDNNKTKYKYLFKLKKQDGDGCIDCGVLSSEDILKASHNITDLIQENDLIQYRINGDLYVSEVKGHPLFNEYILHIEFGNTIIDLEDLQIISIVTEEQYESMAYKVV
jgi:hypothetical protein